MLTAAQICTLACQDARCPGFTTQAGQLLNQILSDLCQQFDFQVARKTSFFNFNTAAQFGPYTLPVDFLRMAPSGKSAGIWYTISGVPYHMISIDLGEFDTTVQTAGLAGFPVYFATDMQVTGGSPFSSGFSLGFGPIVPARRLYVWPSPSGAYPVTLRYYAQLPDIVTPESSALVPWFPNQTYLRRRLAGELMGLTDDERMNSYLGADEDATPNGAEVILRRYLRMEGDKNARAQTVQLDRRRFGSSFDRLRNTKQIGW